MTTEYFVSNNTQLFQRRAYCTLKLQLYDSANKVVIVNHNTSRTRHIVTFIFKLYYIMYILYGYTRLIRLNNKIKLNKTFIFLYIFIFMANISSFTSVYAEMNINNAKMNNNMIMREYANTFCIYPQKR